MDGIHEAQTNVTTISIRKGIRLNRDDTVLNRSNGIIEIDQRTTVRKLRIGNAMGLGIAGIVVTMFSRKTPITGSYLLMSHEKQILRHQLAGMEYRIHIESGCVTFT